jgi:predicted RNase H-like HicB family nuclease
MAIGENEGESSAVQASAEAGLGHRASSEARLAAGYGASDMQTSGVGELAMNYPVVLHKDPDSDYGVTVPDLPGCFSAGRTMDEAVAMAKEAIELHLEGIVADGQAIPRPTEIERHQRNPEFRGGTWAIVSIDQANLRLRAKRINITIPERVLGAIDRFAEEHGETRSGLLTQAATDYIGRAKQESRRQSRTRDKEAVSSARRRATEGR